MLSLLGFLGFLFMLHFNFAMFLNIHRLFLAFIGSNLAFFKLFQAFFGPDPKHIHFLILSSKFLLLFYILHQVCSLSFISFSSLSVTSSVTHPLKFFFAHIFPAHPLFFPHHPVKLLDSFSLFKCSSICFSISNPSA